MDNIKARAVAVGNLTPVQAASIALRASAYPLLLSAF
jgi:hypothetical protein